MSNSWEEISLLLIVFESNLLIVSCLAMARVVITSCFLIFESSFLLARISKAEMRAKRPQRRLKERQRAVQQQKERNQN